MRDGLGVIAAAYSHNTLRKIFAGQAQELLMLRGP